MGKRYQNRRRRHETSRGPRPKEVAAGMANYEAGAFRKWNTTSRGVDGASK